MFGTRDAQYRTAMVTVPIRSGPRGAGGSLRVPLSALIRGQRAVPPVWCRHRHEVAGCRAVRSAADPPVRAGEPVAVPVSASRRYRLDHRGRFAVIGQPRFARYGGRLVRAGRLRSGVGGGEQPPAGPVPLLGLDQGFDLADGDAPAGAGACHAAQG